MKTIRLIAVLISLMFSTAFSQIVSGSISGTMPGYITGYLNDRNGCVPTSIAEVLAYWDLQYSMLNMFPGVSGTNLYTVSNVTNEISQIASDCGTDGTGDTLTTNICPGLVTYAGSMGYAFQATLSGNILPPGVKTHGSQISLAAAWNNLVNSINANEPMLLLVAPDTSGTPSHVTPVFAYSNTSGTDYYEYIADDGIPTWAQFQALDNSPYSVLNEIQINSVPEPSTWAMLIGGATSLLLFRRRRRS